jgi:diacylglycerol O-acyltransferase / wax synthase
MVPRIRRKITSSGRAADQRLFSERMPEGEPMTTAVAGTEPMNAADAAWLHMDRPDNFMVVNTLLWFDRPVDQAAVLQLFQDRVISRFRRFRQRAADPPVTLAPWAAPEWADDPAFALTEHVTSNRLPAPGDQATLQRVANDLANRPLRAGRPLWELHLLDGYGEGSALLLRTHHAIADGVALMQVLLALTDPVDADARGEVLPVHDDTGRAPMPTGATRRAAHRWTAAARHGASIADAVSAPLRAAFTSPGKTADLFSRSRSDAAMLAKLGSGLSAGLITGRNLLQGPLGPGKQRAWTAPVPVEAVKAAGRAAGATVNDLLLTAIAAALHRYLVDHDSLVAEVLVIEPVNLRPAGASLPAGLGNEFGLAFVALPTGEADPGRRLARVRAQLAQIKSSSEGAFIYNMLELMGQIPAGLQNAWIDMFAASATAIVTNVAGPRHRIQLAGSPVTGLLVWVPATGPVGLGFSAVSYAGQLTVSVASDASLVHDHGRLVALIDEEISALARPDCQVSC